MRQMNGRGEAERAEIRAFGRQRQDVNLQDTFGALTFRVRMSVYWLQRIEV